MAEEQENTEQSPSEQQKPGQQKPEQQKSGQPKSESKPGGAGGGRGRGEGRGAASGSGGPRPGGGGDRDRGDRGGPRAGGDRERGGGDRFGGGFSRPDFAFDIDYDKLVGDSLYLDNQAHMVVSRMRDMDTGTRSQLRRLYGAVRRAVRTPEAERQHEFVMLRARLAYTIARHSLRSLDTLEKLLLQVTRKNEAKGYERFRDLFEAIIAYNE